MAQELRTNTDRTTLSRPPSAKIAPPPFEPWPTSPGDTYEALVALPSAKVMFCTVTCGHWGAYRQFPDTVPSEVSQVST